jgi:hypothetical protein
MYGKKTALVALSLIVLTTSGDLRTAFAGILGNPQDREPGYVQPCSLAGVNPAFHPEIFGNPAVARHYGFIRAKDGTWQVMSNCRR